MVCLQSLDLFRETLLSAKGLLHDYIVEFIVKPISLQDKVSGCLISIEEMKSEIGKGVQKHTKTKCQKKCITERVKGIKRISDGRDLPPEYEF